MSENTVNVNIAEAPGISPMASVATLRQSTVQSARAAAASDAYDVAALEASVGPLPGEQTVSERIERTRAEANSHASNARSQRDVFVHAELNPGDGESLAALKSTEADAEEVLKAQRALREGHVAAMQAGADEADAVGKNAKIPAEPSPPEAAYKNDRALRSWLRRRPEAQKEFFLHGGGLVLGAIIVELVVITSVLAVFLRTDDYFKAALYGIPALLLAVVVPELAGRRFAALRRGEKLRAIDLLYGAGLIAWLGTGFLLAGLRVGAEAEKKRASIAEANGVNVSTVEVPFDGFVYAALVFIVLGTGFAVMLITVAFTNPARSAIIDLDSKIVPREATKRRAQAKIAARNAKADLVKANSEETILQYKNFVDHVLPALELELHALYREEFIHALKNPEVTPFLGDATSRSLSLPQRDGQPSELDDIAGSAAGSAGAR